MLTSIKKLVKDSKLTKFQNLEIAREKTKVVKGGNIIMEEIVLA